jgi:hypothetical protein
VLILHLITDFEVILIEKRREKLTLLFPDVKNESGLKLSIVFFTKIAFYRIAIEWQ